MGRLLTDQTSSPLRDIPFLLICLAFVACGALVLNDLCLYTPDSTRYLVWAKSLANFDGFHDTAAPESQRYVVHAPLFALLLAPVAKIFPLNVVASKIVTLCSAVMLLVLCYRWVQLHTSQRYARVAMLILAFNPLVLIFSTEVLSDIPFAVCMVAFFLLMERFVEHPQQPALRILIMSAVLTCGLLTREIGIAMLASAALFLIFKKQTRHALLICAAPILVYALWIYRNEIVIAPLEQPQLRNSTLLTSHFFTSASAGILQEFIARWLTNISLYAGLVRSLVFTPMHALMQFDLVSRDAPLITRLEPLLDVGKYLLGFVVIVFGIIGIYVDRRSSTGALRLLFLSCYVAIVLSYPINDVRFLMPLLLLMIYYMMVGVSSFEERYVHNSQMFRYVVAICAAVFMIPNLAWDKEYISTNRAYCASPLDFPKGFATLSSAPSHFTQPFSVAGGWIQEHEDSALVLLSQWKDLSCFSGGRKVINVDQTIPLDEFENLLRDYNVGMIASVIQKNGLHEFEFQMHESHRFEFIPVARYSSLELLRVESTRDHRAEDHAGSEFLKGLELLDHQDYAAAEKILSKIRARDPKNLPAMFYTAVAKEFEGKFPGADSLFSVFRRLPQAGMYLTQALIHKQIIATYLDLASQNPRWPELADAFVRIAGQYWNLGFRARARAVVEDALRADSTSFIALTFSLHFALQQQDTVNAKKSFYRTAHVQADHPLVRTWGAIFQRLDSLGSTSDSVVRSRLLFEIAKIYASMGLSDHAIDFALNAAQEDRNNLPTLFLAADLYDAKRLYAPETSMLTKILSIDGRQAGARERLLRIAVQR